MPTLSSKASSVRSQASSNLFYDVAPEFEHHYHASLFPPQPTHSSRTSGVAHPLPHHQVNHVLPTSNAQREESVLNGAHPPMTHEKNDYKQPSESFKISTEDRSAVAINHLSPPSSARRDTDDKPKKEPQQRRALPLHQDDLTEDDIDYLFDSFQPVYATPNKTNDTDRSPSSRMLNSVEQARAVSQKDVSGSDLYLQSPFKPHNQADLHERSKHLTNDGNKRSDSDRMQHSGIAGKEEDYQQRVPLSISKNKKTSSVRSSSSMGSTVYAVGFCEDDTESTLDGRSESHYVGDAAFNRDTTRVYDRQQDESVIQPRQESTR